MKHLEFYSQRVTRKPRIWNVRPRVTQYPPAFRRLFADWTPAMHARRAAAIVRLRRIIQAKQRAAIERGEREFGTESALLTGGSREHWPREAKDACLVPAQAHALYGDALCMHESLSKQRRRHA